MASAVRFTMSSTCSVGLEADDEGVDRAQAEHVTQRGVLPLGGVDSPLAQDFHADDAFAGVVHLFEDRGDLVRLAVVHDQPFGVDPRQVDLDERVLGRTCAGDPCRGSSCRGPG